MVCPLEREGIPVVCPSQPYSCMKHMLLSVYGSQWKKRILAMFSLYIDDSGSDPNQPVAIAAGLMIPSLQLEAFEREWNRFLDKEDIRADGFHSSECCAHDPKQETPFASWGDGRVARVFERVLQFMRKYAIKGFCIAAYKKDYDELVPPDMRVAVSKSHFVWALSSVLGLSFDWGAKRSSPIEYVFDLTDKDIKRDITEAMDYSAENGYGDHFTAHHSFRSRKDVPGLQLADFFAWHCYKAACKTIVGTPMPDIAVSIWARLYPHITDNADDGKLLVIQRLNREGLTNWVNKTYGTPVELSVRAYKKKRKEARMPKRKKAVINPSSI